MIKVDSDLLQKFYYSDELKKIIAEMSGAEYVDFGGLGFDENEQKVEIYGELEFSGQEPIEIEVTGKVTENMVIFTNNYMNKAAIFSLKTGKYHY